ncbi:hypothetical protein [Roseateles sp.]|uniref:hypothetical protein n=1 Tax=Roseateles sp. TaxID=1971397 RepID=UPI0039E97BB2
MLRRSFLCLLATTAATDVFALYDPPPQELLRFIPGTWSGTLTYRDWSKPDRLVKLPCRVNASLMGPMSVSLSFLFDDGPSKQVYSYDRWLFDFAKREMVWVSGTDKEERSAYVIASASRTDAGNSITLTQPANGKVHRQQLVSSQQALQLTKVDVSGDGQEIFRNAYELRRVDA